MKGRILAALVLAAALAAPAAFAQQNSPQSEPPQAAAASNQASQAEVSGTIVTLSADKIEVNVDSVTAPPEATAGSTIMVGKTTSFALDAATERPQGLQVGDRISLWFANDNGSLRATRLALAVSADTSAGSNENASNSQPSSTSPASAPQASSTTGSSSSEQSTSGSNVSGSTSSTSEQSPSSAEPSSSTAPAKGAHRANLPKTGSPLPLIGLVGLVALGTALVLRFAVRA